MSSQYNDATTAFEITLLFVFITIIVTLASLFLILVVEVPFVPIPPWLYYVVIVLGVLFIWWSSERVQIRKDIEELKERVAQLEAKL